MSRQAIVALALLCVGCSRMPHLVWQEKKPPVVQAPLDSLRVVVRYYGQFTDPGGTKHYIYTIEDKHTLDEYFGVTDMTLVRPAMHPLAFVNVLPNITRGYSAHKPKPVTRERRR